MRHFFLLLLVSASVISAEAHLGNENNTEVRIFSDGMRVVMRTSIPLAWKLIGSQAPVMADQAGQAAARPLLIAVAAELIAVTAGGDPMTPARADVMFELDKDVAFVLNFHRPSKWPVEVDAEFFNQVDSLESGTITVFDYTASRFSRDLEPIALKTISQGDTTLSFRLAAAEVPVTAPNASGPAPVLAAAPTAGDAPPPAAIILLLAGAGVIGFLTWRRLRSMGRRA